MANETVTATATLQGNSAPTATTPAAAAPPAASQTPTTPQQSPPQAPSLLSSDAPKAESPKETPKPVEIKLTLPKDSMLQQAHVDKIAAFARERGLSQEQAQAALEFQGSQLKEFADGHLKAWSERVAGWEKELTANKEFGGEKLKEFDSGASEVVNKYGGQDMMKLLKESGYGKHPVVAQFLWNIHKAMRPDKIVAPQAQSTGEKADLAERLFPKTVKK